MGAATGTASDMLSYDRRTGVIETYVDTSESHGGHALSVGTYPIGSVHKWTVVERTGEVGILASGSVFRREEVYPDQTTTELEGDVESIEGDEAMLVVRIGNQYVERFIPTKILETKGAGFEGARVKLIIREVGGVVSSEIRNISEVAKPYWLEPNEELGEVLQQLKAHLSRQKSK